ncbi:MAG: OsmC family protein [Thermoanaerobaculia bacterium]
MSQGRAQQAVTSIESLGTPLAFKVRTAGLPAGRDEARNIRIRSEVRALEGMQKEALVYDASSKTVWRMVSDEGPYLEGTDLAPFPLGFYTAGVVFSYMTEILRHAATLGVEVASLDLTSDHYYTMQGSALRGDMIGGAMPIEVTVGLQTDAEEPKELRILEMAQASSPAEAYMRDSLRNTFSLVANGRDLELDDLPELTAGDRASRPDFDGVEPLAGECADDIISKLAAAEVVHGVVGGAGSSLQAVQKRILHVRGEAKLISDTLKEIEVHLLQPIGSSFRFQGEDGGRQRAPSAPAYLSAGIGFCFMTQLGRYAHITKRSLTSYEIVQENVFHYGSTDATGVGQATAEPVDTRVFLALDETDEVARKMVSMGERTCFLHAALRGSHPTRVRRT